MDNLIYAQYEELFSTLLKLMPAGEQVYLVGGALRDLYLQKPSHDFDFVLHGRVRRFARRVADHLGGAFYMLDNERETARVICYQSDGERQVFDFAALRADDIEADLRARDFTINAMALNISPQSELIDPLDGLKHIREKKLVSCNPSSFEQDPLRILRGVRLALMLDYRIQPDTLRTMKDAVPLLETVSAERLRDELFRIFSEKRSAAALRTLQQIGVTNLILPELSALKNLQQPLPHVLDAWEHTLATMDALEALLDVIVDRSDSNAGGKSLFLGIAMLGARRFRKPLADYLNEKLTDQRMRRQLLYLAALYHDIGKPAAMQKNEEGKITFYSHEIIGAEVMQKTARNLAMSEVEVRYLEMVVRHHMRLHQMAHNEGPPSKRAVHRFFRSADSAGVGVCLLSLADTLATYRQTLQQPVWMKEVEICSTLLSSWFEEKYQVIDPPQLLTGNDLIKTFDLKPGPVFSRILSDLKEAQAVGEVLNREEALDFVKKWLASPENVE